MGDSMKRLAICILGLLLLSPGTAAADRASLAEPDDSGSQRVWDVISIAHSHGERNGTRVLRHKITFDQNVSGTDFSQGYHSDSGITLYFEFNGRNDTEEREARFERERDGSLVVVVAHHMTGEVRGFAKWFQPSPDKLTIEFPKALLKKGLDRYKWKVLTSSRLACEPGEPSDGCMDESGWLRHLLH